MTYSEVESYPGQDLFISGVPNFPELVQGLDCPGFVSTGC
jgi:hypothetical protein